MPDWTAKTGRPLTPREADKLQAMIADALDPVDGVIEHTTIRSVMAADRLRMMEMQGVPLDQLLAEATPETIKNAIDTWGVTPAKARMMTYAAHNTGVYLHGFKADVQGRVVKLVNALQSAGVSPVDASRRLFQEFGKFNRDWRTIAATESAMNANNGFIAGRPTGSYVVGQSYPDCCVWCTRNVHGKILRVAEPPSKEDKERDWDNEIWVGKSNYTRYQSSREAGTGRVRKDHEMWKPAVVQHPNCRCWWTAFDPRYQTVDATGAIQIRTDL